MNMSETDQSGKDAGDALPATASLVRRLRRSVVTASNDDHSKPGTVERRRHLARVATMERAAEFLEGLTHD